MAETKYLALLRGINVGGNNIIKMAELKLCFEDLGFSDVLTFIQSGNVLFVSAERDKLKLTRKIETALSQRFKYEARLVTVSYKELKNVVEKAPRGFGKDPDWRYDVVFLKQPLTAKKAIKSINPKEGIDQAYAGEGVMYFARLSAKASQSRLTRIIGTPNYKSMTIRNWNTTTKLLALTESAAKKVRA